jgi:hypothetical protein
MGKPHENTVSPVTGSVAVVMYTASAPSPFRAPPPFPFEMPRSSSSPSGLRFEAAIGLALVPLALLF